MRIALMLAALAPIAAPAAAQTRAEIDRRYSEVYKVCMKSGPGASGVTIDMMNCIGNEIEVQDGRLNQAYKMIMQRLKPAPKAKLRASERRWIATRDATCKKQAAQYEGGSFAGVQYSSCILDETIKRTIWLEHYRG